MSLSLTGTVMNVYAVAARTDPATGEIRPAASKVQIMGEIKQGDGSVRYDMHDLRTDRGTAFMAAKGKKVRCPVAIFNIEGTAGLYLPKNAEIELVDDTGKKTGLLDSLPDSASKARA